ncbi:6-phosphogluconate dehydrogenase [Streptococcus suis 05ZYH33]|nr:6-phosphogluconate dehydrogenase [Streptococcus suis 05ZYH33]
MTYIGPDGAGHYVKMVHNGIEYGDMQLIAESYDLMQHLLGCQWMKWLTSSLTGTKANWIVT